MSRGAVLGIDTSNYTTSVALLDMEGRLIYETRKILDVKKGTKGLRQSDALFQHIKNLPLLMQELRKNSTEFHLIAVSASTKPRPLKESYMPVFLASQSYGETLSHALQIPFYEVSHQEGHIAAGLWAENIKLEQPFLGLHISGGTTELLKIVPLKVGYHIEILGGTKDISAGQLIDRVGAKLGLSFPCGSYLEKLSLDGNRMDNKIRVPFSVKDCSINFSGPETYLLRLIDQDVPKNEVAFLTFECVAQSLYQLISNALKNSSLKDLLIVGGVASNKQIRSYLLNKLSETINIYFVPPQYCTDNAVGTAALGLANYLLGQQNCC